MENGPYHRAGEFPASLVIEQVGKVLSTNSGAKVLCGGWRLEVYASKGTKCVNCGLVGNVFAAECFRHLHQEKPVEQRKYHLNLYHVDSSGRETMMTVDHIIPKSKGGGNGIENLQPMCFPCNIRKGNQTSTVGGSLYLNGLASIPDSVKKECQISSLS